MSSLPTPTSFVADILYSQENLEEALEAFQEIRERFPTAAKAPGSLYRIALIQIDMDDMEEAEQTLERIVNTYAGTDIAELAEDKLGEIRSPAGGRFQSATTPMRRRTHAHSRAQKTARLP